MASSSKNRRRGLSRALSGVLATLVIASAVAACGGSGISEAAWTTKANAICANANPAVKRDFANDNFSALATLFRGASSRLAALGTPTSHQASAKAFDGLVAKYPGLFESLATARQDRRLTAYRQAAEEIESDSRAAVSLTKVLHLPACAST